MKKINNALIELNNACDDEYYVVITNGDKYDLIEYDQKNHNINKYIHIQNSEEELLERIKYCKDIVIERMAKRELKIKSITPKEIVLEQTIKSQDIGRYYKNHKTTITATITHYHDADCSEENWADFEQLDDLARTYIFKGKLVFSSNNHGFMFGDNRRQFFVPCYSEQNGWYSSDIDIYLNVCLHESWTETGYDFERGVETEVEREEHYDCGTRLMVNQSCKMIGY